MHLCSILALVAGLAVELCMVLMLGKCTCSSEFRLNCFVFLRCNWFVPGGGQQDVPGNCFRAMVIVDEFIALQICCSVCDLGVECRSEDHRFSLKFSGYIFYREQIMLLPFQQINGISLIRFALFCLETFVFSIFMVLAKLFMLSLGTVAQRVHGCMYW